MDESSVRVTFTCKQCGGNTIVLPDEPIDASIAICKSCGSEVGRWGDIKTAATETVKEQVEEDMKKSLRDVFRGVDGIKFE